jgi:gluconokinase
MEVLCFDIGSGGISAARFNGQLQISAVREIPWDLHRDAQGRATLSSDDIESAILQLSKSLQSDSPPAAVSIACFMHSFLVLSSCCAPLTPVFTWLDTTAAEGIAAVRRQVGDRFHELTGCHYHPMFPVFKLAANPAGRGNRVGSPKAWLGWELTGSFVEDFGMAAASGLLNVKEGKWDEELLKIANLEQPDLPAIANPHSIVGAVSESAAARFGIPRVTTVVSGSGDGFLANVGSACASPRRMAVTLGTSGVARQMVSAPALMHRPARSVIARARRRFCWAAPATMGGMCWTGPGVRSGRSRL